MFSNPVPADQYLRVDEYIASTGSNRPRVFQQLALPAQREDRVRLVHKFRDKAVLNALETFLVTRAKDPAAGIPKDLEPVARYFREQFRQSYLHAGERVLRTDIWFGNAPIPPPGQRVGRSAADERHQALARYWDGPSEAFPADTAPEPDALQHEADIVWKLEYVDVDEP